MKIVMVNLGEGRKYNQIDECSGLASVGIESIATYLEANGFDVSIVDQSMYHLSIDEVIEQVMGLNPDIIGLNPLNNFRNRVGEIVRKVKSKLPSVISVIGGYDATFRLLADYDASVDFLIRGNGEAAMKEIIERIQAKQPVQDIQGVAYRNGKEVVENIGQFAEKISMDDLPWPVRQNIDYLSKCNETVSIIGSRGCWSNCAFCSTPQMYPQGREERSLAILFQEIDYLLENGIRRFSFWDEDFYGIKQASIQRADEIIRYIGSRNAKITFTFITAPGLVRAEKMDLIRRWEGVVERVYAGIEGGCNEALKNLGNHCCMDSDINARAINLIRKYNISLQIGFIMFNPYSTFRELADSANFLHKNNEAINSVSFFHRVRPYPGTKLYKQLNDQDILNKETCDQEFNLHTSMPYKFQNDKVSEMAKSLASVEDQEITSKVDRLNIEVVSELIRQGNGISIFDDTAPKNNDIVGSYKELRQDISRLNYGFFTDSLELFSIGNHEDFLIYKNYYLLKLTKYTNKLEKLKEAILRNEKLKVM